LVINEFMARNSNVIADSFGEFDDWIEIHNTSNTALNLAGYFLSDGIGNATEFEFPAVVIPAQGYIIVWADGQPEQGNLHAFFGLSGDGDDIMLCDPDTNTIDFITFGAQLQNVPEGRIPNGLGSFTCPFPTPGAANTENNPTAVGDVETKVAQLALWPNPSSTACTIENFRTESLKLEVMDIRGARVEQYTIVPGRQAIDISGLSPGVYFLRTEYEMVRLVKVPL
jgi:hypothetical protein